MERIGETLRRRLASAEVEAQRKANGPKKIGVQDEDGHTFYRPVNLSRRERKRRRRASGRPW